MSSWETGDKFSQIHIDIARNTTDDFNLFHDLHGWSRIVNNPFQGPIVLGFQIESLIEHKIYLHRKSHDEMDWMTKNHLNFSNYQFSFANAIKAEQDVLVDVRKSQISATDVPSISNRVSVKSDGKLALIGFKKETQTPLFLNNTPFNGVAFQNIDLKHYPDRSFLEASLGGFFLKRKYMSASNAKNFLCGSLVDQRLYFDELKNQYQYPELFPCAFISCALLEKSLQENLDFEKKPLVYTSHKISVDRLILSQLKSNGVLHILIRQTENNDPKSSLQTYECYGLVDNHAILFRAIVEVIPLEAILQLKK